MSPQQFAALAAQGYRQIPLTRTLLADLDTPLGVYAKLARGGYTYLLESVEAREKWGRYSIIGLAADAVIRVCGREVSLCRGDGGLIERRTVADPLRFIQEYIGEFAVPKLPELPRFAGGLVGYVGYDAVRFVEPRLADSAPPDALGVPDILLMRSRDLVIFDTFAGTLTLVTHVDADAADGHAQGVRRLDALADRLATPAPPLGEVCLGAPPLDEAGLESSMGRAGYERAVERIKEYCAAGDLMQAVPSQRLSLPFSADPSGLYRALRAVNPSPYMYFMDFGDFQIVGASPEILARLERGEVTVRPIAGTRRRGKTEAEDLAMEREMLEDPKEIAEHLMLIDLGRNDVGRVAQTGSVRVAEQMVVERYSHVMHISSTVVGQLRPGLDAIDLLRAVHPAGTLSGAPKIRAMEVIDELEPVKRGIYGGAVGYIGWNANMDMAIAIRTGLIKDGVLHVQAGGGIVADSVPRLEWKESMNKARALLRAAAMVRPSGVPSGAPSGEEPRP